jgi:hypothetical protein
MKHTVTLMVALAAITSNADLLYDNGGPNLANGNLMTVFVQAEDFELAGTASIDHIRFWTIEDGDWSGGLQWWIFDDGAGIPGSIVSSGEAANVSRIATGNTALGLYTEFVWEFDMTPTSLVGCTIYYLGLSSAGSTDMYWETTDNGPTPFGWESFNAKFNNWFSNDQEHAFELYGTVPEPAGYVALLGFLCLLRSPRSRLRK